MSARTATGLVALLYVLHQDIWFWREARPLVFGVLPIGLFYHVAFTVASSVVIWLLVKSAWPAGEKGSGVFFNSPGEKDSRPLFRLR
jgi:hypothetical protein